MLIHVHLENHNISLTYGDAIAVTEQQFALYSVSFHVGLEVG